MEITPDIEPALKNFDSRSKMLKGILIADDNVYVREVIRAFLHDQAEIEVCGEAVDGVETIEKTRQLKPDLVLLSRRTRILTTGSFLNCTP